LVFHSSTIAMMHGPINIRSTPQLVLKQCFSHILVLFVETSFGAHSDVMSHVHNQDCRLMEVWLCRM